MNPALLSSDGETGRALANLARAAVLERDARALVAEVFYHPGRHSRPDFEDDLWPRLRARHRRREHALTKSAYTYANTVAPK